MKNLPESEIYEKEFLYMPWGILIKKILSIIKTKTPKNVHVLDLMCGPGYLLGEIQKIRPDLILEGSDIDEGFIFHATKKYQNINFSVQDVLKWNPTKKYDLILCTGGIHHLPYDKQPIFIGKISKALNKNGFCIVADPYVDDYKDEKERKLSASKLGYEYMIATMKNGADDEVIKAAIDILYNDVMGFEFKTSLKKLKPIFDKNFSKVEAHKTWPDKDSEYGDYFLILN